MSTPFIDPTTLSPHEREHGSQLAPRFDSHGLITAITIEAGSNQVLMVAHMNAQALALTLETGQVHYWSRSRGKLWKKGESSGEIQHLVELRLDCDQDAVLVVVEQTGRGAACHTGKKSCFYRKVEMGPAGPHLVDAGVEQVFDPKDVYGG